MDEYLPQNFRAQSEKKPATTSAPAFSLAHMGMGPDDYDAHPQPRYLTAAEKAKIEAAKSPAAAQPARAQGFLGFIARLRGN